MVIRINPKMANGLKVFSGPHFLAFGLNMDQKNSEHGHFSRSVCYKCTLFWTGETVEIMYFSKIWHIWVGFPSRCTADKPRQGFHNFFNGSKDFPFRATGFFLYPLKTSENLRFSKFFKGYRKKSKWYQMG